MRMCVSVCVFVCVCECVCLFYYVLYIQQTTYNMIVCVHNVHAM